MTVGESLRKFIVSVLTSYRALRGVVLSVSPAGDCLYLMLLPADVMEDSEVPDWRSRGPAECLQNGHNIEPLYIMVLNICVVSALHYKKEDIFLYTDAISHTHTLFSLFYNLSVKYFHRQFLQYFGVIVKVGL